MPTWSPGLLVASHSDVVLEPRLASIAPPEDRDLRCVTFRPLRSAAGMGVLGDCTARDGVGPVQALAGLLARGQQTGKFCAGSDAELAIGAREVGFHGLAGDE